MLTPDANSDLKTPSNLLPRSKSYVWVNPKSPRASQLRRKSFDVRYPALVSTAEALNSCNPAIEDVSRLLVGLGGDLVEHDAVTVLNNMTNPKTVLVALDYFLSKLKSTRQVVLYNVTLKVLRRCRDWGSAEQLFDQMLQRGIPCLLIQTMAITAICCLVGWIAIAFSQAVWSLNFGRLLVGAGMGLISYVIPVYAEEITPKNLRGGAVLAFIVEFSQPQNMKLLTHIYEFDLL